jgi:hypothetical protein
MHHRLTVPSPIAQPASSFWFLGRPASLYRIALAKPRSPRAA